MCDFCHLLVVERRTAVEDRALVVEHIVAQTVVEVHTQGEALPTEVEEDVTKEVGIGVADDALVGSVDLAVVVQILEEHVTCSEILTCTGLVDNIEVGSLCGLGRGEDALGLVAVEHAHGVTHSGQDVVVAIDRRGVVAVGQRLDLVLIVTDGSTNLQTQVVGGNGFAVNAHLETSVLDLTVVGPVVVDTADGVLKRLQGQQVLGAMDEVVGTQTQTVVEEVGLQTDIQFRRGLPLDLLVTHIGELHTNLAVVVAHGIKRGAGSVVADAVITAHVEADIQAQVVDGRVFREPVLVAHHPAQLHAGEYGPFHTGQLHTTIGIAAETAVRLSQHRDGGEVFVHVVIVAGEIPLHILPDIVGTLDGGVDIVARSEFRVLIVLELRGVLCTQVAVVVREIGIAEATHRSDVVGTEFLVPIDVGVTQHVDLLGEDRGGLGIDRTQILDSERRQTDVGTIVSLRVTVEVVTEMRGQLPVLTDFVGRCQRDVEEGVLVTVLTLTRAVGHQRQRVGLRIVAVVQGAEQVVGICKQRGKRVDVLVILIRIEQRTLDQRQEGGRGDDTGIQVGSNTLIEEVMISA